MTRFHVYDLLEIETPIRIVDVGAAQMKGTVEPYQFLIDKGVASLTAFEPNQNACAALNEKFSATENRCLPYFVGDGSESTFHICKAAVCSSLYPPNKDVLSLFQGLEGVLKEVDSEQITTTRLDDIDGLGDVDFLKLDVQGGELDVLKGAKKKLQETMIVFSEVEFVQLYKDQPLFGDIDRELRDNGFMFHCFVGMASRAFKPMIVDNNVNKGLKQTLWGDALFVRDPRTFSDLSTEKLKKHALIMHEMMESWDVTLHILNVLDERNGTKLCSAYIQRF